MNVDSTCRMHYQVRLHGIERREEFKIVLEDHPMRNLKALHLAPGRQMDLQVSHNHTFTLLNFETMKTKITVSPHRGSRTIPDYYNIRSS